MAELIDAIRDFRSWPSNFAHNADSIAKTLDLKMYIRIVAIIGGYIFIRPYIIKFFARTSMKSQESVEVLGRVLDGKAVGANDFRGIGRASGRDKDGEGKAKGDEGWGEKARRRQLTGAERKKREEEARLRIARGEKVEDGELLDLLEDYDEGVDGW